MSGNESTVQSSARIYGPLDPPEKRPHKNTPLWLPILLGIICVGLSISCCILWIQMSVAVNTATQLEVENDSLERESRALTGKIIRLENSLSDAQESSSLYASQLTTAKDTLLSLVDEVAFWEGSAVIVTESGNMYHRWDCQYVADREFWIYNVENAIYKGYRPCSVCDPPER